MFGNPVVKWHTPFLQTLQPRHAIRTMSRRVVDKGEFGADGVGGGFPGVLVFGNGAEEEEDVEAAAQFEMLECEVGGPFPEVGVEGFVGGGGTLARTECTSCSEGIGWDGDGDLDFLVIDYDFFRHIGFQACDNSNNGLSRQL